MVKVERIHTDNAKDILRNADIKITPNRVLVLQEILERNCAFTLNDMENIILSLDKSTLCRRLNLFLDCGILHEVDNGKGHKMYCRCACSAKSKVSQIHFTCLLCSKTFCIRNLIKEDLDTPTFSYPEDFEITEVNFLLKGLCPECKNKAR